MQACLLDQNTPVDVVQFQQLMLFKIRNFCPHNVPRILDAVPVQHSIFRPYLVDSPQSDIPALEGCVKDEKCSLPLLP